MTVCSLVHYDTEPLCKIHYWTKGCTFLPSFVSLLSKQLSALTSLSVSFGPLAEWKCCASSHGACILSMTKWTCERVWNTCSSTAHSGTWAGREKGELLIFHPAEGSLLSLVSGARFWFQLCVPTSFCSGNRAGALDLQARGQKHNKASFFGSMLCTRHGVKDFVSIISFHLKSSKGPMR